MALILLFAAYRYVYKAHRDISSEDASVVLSVAQLKEQFAANPGETTTKLLDQTIVIYGKVSTSDLKTKNLLVDDLIDVTLTNATETLPKVGDIARIKGRYVGFDDLLEQHKMVDAIIIKE